MQVVLLIVVSFVTVLLSVCLEHKIVFRKLFSPSYRIKIRDTGNNTFETRAQEAKNRRRSDDSSSMTPENSQSVHFNGIENFS